MVKLSFYVPETHLEVVKSALFAVGAGRIGNYDSCCWQTLGVGQFRPLPGSEPFVGEQGTVERVPEYLVEMVCEHDLVPKVVDALKSAHPYEEPAFGFYPMLEVR